MLLLCNPGLLFNELGEPPDMLQDLLHGHSHVRHVARLMRHHWVDFDL